VDKRPSRRWGVLWDRPDCSREFGMKWRVILELVGPDGIVAASLAAKYERPTAVITINSN
jgi:hypothetical protein